MTPRVTPEYKAERRLAIANAAATCFAREGFHGTSVHDICAAADISAGAFYSYFDSKEAVVSEMCSHGIDELRVVDDLHAHAESVSEVFIALVDHFFGELRDSAEARDAMKVSVQLWAEAARPGEIRDVLATDRAAKAEIFAGFIRQAQTDGDINPDLDPTSVASVMFGTFEAAVLNCALNPGFDLDQYMTTVKALFTGTFLETAHG